jgi:hypothetical protein
MMDTAVLVPPLALLLPNDTRRGCVDAEEGRTHRLGNGDGLTVAATSARRPSLRQFARFRSNPLACLHAFSDSLAPKCPCRDAWLGRGGGTPLMNLVAILSPHRVI